MKKLLFILFTLITISYCLLGMTKNNIQTSKFKDGDIIFHTSTSGQSKMLQVATKSKLTHVGIIFHIKGVPYVFEAVQPVSYRSLNSFIKSGVNGDYVVLRPRNELTQTQIDIMKNYAMKQMGKNYDIQFTWGNDKMYCSELVYKVYESAGINICAKNKFSSFDLSNEMVKNAIFSRYNKSGKKFDINEVVVAPVDIYKSWNLKTVESTYSFF